MTDHKVSTLSTGLHPRRDAHSASKNKLFSNEKARLNSNCANEEKKSCDEKNAFSTAILGAGKKNCFLCLRRSSKLFLHRAAEKFVCLCSQISFSPSNSLRVFEDRKAKFYCCSRLPYRFAEWTFKRPVELSPRGSPRGSLIDSPIDSPSFGGYRSTVKSSNETSS